MGTCRRLPKSASTRSPKATATAASTSEAANTAEAEGLITSKRLINGTVPASTDLDTSTLDTSTVAEQIAELVAADPQAQINVRSQPSSASEPVGYGQVGETVILGHSEPGTDGYTWHRVTFQSDNTAGWIRGDLLDIPPLEPVASQPATAASVNQGTSEALQRSLTDTCGSTRAVEAHFVTASNSIYICKVRSRRIYLSQEAGTEQVIQAEDVEALDTGYIIGNDNFEYRLDASSLVVVRLSDSGRQEEVLREPVIHSERY
ncbi:MAG: SH3 domain-containing protein [Cyanobacteria bacterium P01_C01_bin.120]